MDGGNSFPQHQQPGDALCSIPGLRSQLALPDMENSMLAADSWSSCYSAPFPTSSFPSENQQYFNLPQDFYMNSISRPHFLNTNYATMDPADFLPKNGDFPQDSSYLDELSNNSLFSSPADSLSDIADPKDFLPADSLTHVPTLWDVNTPQNPIELFSPSTPFPGLNSSHDHVPAVPNTPLLISYQSQAPAEEEDEGEEEETEELGQTETYAEYIPSKSKIGKHHPDLVVETSTLSSVPPPDITYRLSLPCSVADKGSLSALQLEAIIYACQQHEVLLPNGQRAGFLIGDGAGVGKGRTVAGIIFENYLKGRKKALWFSVSNDLKYDAERDLKDIEASHIPVHALNKIKYGDTATSEGVLFATYSALIGESQAGGQHRTRLKQILDWCRENFDGVIVFDECHKAKNANSTKMGKAVLDLQNKLPQARVVYASATGASEPKNMIYMSRLGIWGEGTPFRAFDEFLHAIEKRGVGAMEIVAMDMKVSGMYIARQLSFTGVTFRIEEIPLDEQYKAVYDKAAKLWAEALMVFQQAADCIGLESRKSLWGQFWSAHQRFFKYLCIAAKVRRLVELAREELARDKCIVIGLQSTGEARTREVLDENDGHLNHFVSAAEFCSLDMLRLQELPRTWGWLSLCWQPWARIDLSSMECGRPRGRCSKAFRGLCDQGVIKISDDSSTESDMGLDSDFNSSPESLHESDDVIYVEPTYNGCAAEGDFHMLPSQKELQGLRELEMVEKMKQDLLAKVQALGKELPLNTLDELINYFGGPENVAEMTGRKGRVVRRPDGSIVFESRAEQGLSIDHVNLKEKERFMKGEKLVAIISEASSSGISLQADRRVKNQKRRVHMTLELPWSADRAIQQFGRTHRSNQVSAPEYVFLISELAGERRFASIVAKRLESLGALTHGDRRATESRDLSKYNFENKYGAKALDRVLSTILSHTENRVPVPKSYEGREADFFREMKQGLISMGICCSQMKYGTVSVEKDCSITKFLNRILGLEVDKQNMLFQYFSDTFDYLIEKDKKEGKYDMGILDLAPGVDEIYEESKEVFLTPGHPQDGQVVFYKISVDRGLKWEEAYEKSLTLTGTNEGFYLSYKMRGSKYTCLLAEQSRGKNFILYKPNIGKQSQPESLDSLQKKYRRVMPEEAKEHWENSYHFSLKNCNHAMWNKSCKLIQEGKECFQGMRLRHYYMLCGALLRVWSRIAGIMASITSSSYLQIVRLKTKEKKKQVGIKIPESCVHKVREELKQMDEDVKRKHSRLLQAQEQGPPFPLPLHILPGPRLPLPSLCQDEILDLTYSPPSSSIPDVVMNAEPGALCFPSEPPLQPHQQHQLPFGFGHAPGLEGGVAPGPSRHESPALPPPPPLQQPLEDFLHQDGSINFREILEDMLRPLPQERQSVIQFSGPFPDF
ncbi:Protein strawberry notch 2 [Willisornis vidua]|uniref:Protein strawberry notch 2 n=1 Tax=Willisornis vidua TaxID=1566151 RepID=A0ABQ9CZB4_9PASS|nr:Protein strawberry notch 2 [Willisornis vidua]